MLQGLHAAGLHGHAEHRLLPADGADLVLLGSLFEHDHELVGDDGVEHRNDDHGEHEGDESVDLQGKDAARSRDEKDQRSERLCFISHSNREAACSGNVFPPLTVLPLAFEGLLHRGKTQTPLTYIHPLWVNTEKKQIHSQPITLSSPFQCSSLPEMSPPKHAIDLSISRTAGRFLALIVCSATSK